MWLLRGHARAPSLLLWLLLLLLLLLTPTPRIWLGGSPWLILLRARLLSWLLLRLRLLLSWLLLAVLLLARLLLRLWLLLLARHPVRTHSKFRTLLQLFSQFLVLLRFLDRAIARNSGLLAGTASSKSIGERVHRSILRDIAHISMSRCSSLSSVATGIAPNT